MRIRVLIYFALTASLTGQQRFDASTLLQLARVGDPQISPDARNVAFSVQTVDLVNNKKPKQIFIVPLNGGAPKLLSEGDRPRWMPDSKRIVFDSDRGGSPQ